MKERAIELMKRKGIKDAERVLDELMDSGTMTHYDLCKYVAREEFHHRAVKFPKRKPMVLVREISADLSISERTIRRML